MNSAGEEAPGPQDRPDPKNIDDAVAFVAALRRMRVRAGLSFRALERRAGRAGDVLPSSTINAALSRDKLPRADLVAAFVRACGGDEPTIETWVAARNDLAARSEGSPEPAAEAEFVPKPTGRAKWRRAAVIAVAAVAAGAAIIALSLTFGQPESHEPVAAQRQAPPATPTPQLDEKAAGPLASVQRIRLAHTGLCLGEGPEKFTASGRDVLGQHDCASAGPPVGVEADPDGSFRLLLHSPENGPGCVTTDYGGSDAEVLLAGHECEDGRPDQRYTFEPVGSPANGYRIHSVPAPKWCIGVFQHRTEPGVQLIQDRCDGSLAQIFLVE
ncbi:helix-turn-helix domain-containing protein [Saccharopolyspora sp. NPDC050389]|uniref:helix-turn-helix domain-containing protein n=1 Tax=Saccharopolyspora sp. NPDC050389 TaxID=3155516 RepID=UPI0034094EEF